MQVKTIVIRGTVGPIYRAVLRVVERHQRHLGVPSSLGLTAHENAVIVTTDEVLCESLHFAMSGDLSHGDTWPWLGEPPTSVRAEIV